MDIDPHDPIPRSHLGTRRNHDRKTAIESIQIIYILPPLIILRQDPPSKSTIFATV